MVTKHYLKIIIPVAIVTGFSLCIFSVKLIKFGYGFWSGGFDIDASGLVGNFIGGVIGTVFSAGAFVWAYISLLEQQKRQSEEQLENRFFELLELHRRNVDEMIFDASGRVFDPNTISVSSRVHQGKAVFHEVFKQIVSCRNELAPFFKKKTSVYDPDYLRELESNSFLRENNIQDFLDLALIDISFCIVFFGVGAEGKRVLNSLFSRKYKNDFIGRLLEYISLKPADDEEKYQRWKYISERKDIRRRSAIAHAISLNRNMEPYDEEFISFGDKKYIDGFDSHFVKYYGGHQFRLGHYFRHLYQTVRYINERTDLSYTEKYGYIKILRAQLSNYEQAVLFFNSLSQVGRNWEMNAVPNKSCHCLKSYDFELITKYNLIKNIPLGALLRVEPLRYYSHVEYEFDYRRVERKAYN